MQHLCEDSQFSDPGKFWKISEVKIHMQFFFISCKLECSSYQNPEKNLKDRHFRKENSFFGFENCGKFSGNFGKCNALGPSIPLEEYKYKFQLDCSKTPHKSVSLKKISSPKKCLFQKKFYPEKWVFPENCVFIKKRVSPDKIFT